MMAETSTDAAVEEKKEAPGTSSEDDNGLEMKMRSTLPRKGDPLLTGDSMSSSRVNVSRSEGDNAHHSDDESFYYEDSIAGDYQITDGSGLDCSDDDDEGDNMRRAAKQQHGAARDTASVRSSSDDDEDFAAVQDLTPRDLEMCHRLDQEFEMALEERDVAYHARYQSVRQSACFAVGFMVIFLTASIAFFLNETEDWDVADAMLFSVYSITTVGYGNLHNPETPSFQLYTVAFILVGIATLTIMVAQVYQCVALEASRAQHSRDSGLLSNISGGSGMATTRTENSHNNWMPQHHRSTASVRNSVGQIGDLLHVPTRWMDRLFVYIERLMAFLRENEIGRGISVLLPFVGLILIGAVVMGPLEGWSATEALYFSVVSLTTVGFGEYYPSRQASIWFCILWLPFSIGFMSLYLTSVAAFYIRLSDQNIIRIERQLQRRVEQSKRKVEEERQAARRRALRGQEQYNTDVPTVSTEEEQHSLPLPEEIMKTGSLGKGRQKGRRGFDTVPMTEEDGSTPRLRTKSRPTSLFGSRASTENRRERILRASRLGDDSGRGISEDSPAASSSSAMTTMRDVLRTVHFNLEKPDSYGTSLDGGRVKTVSDVSDFFSIRSFETVQTNSSLRSRSLPVRKPSFALRVLVQERIAEIIALDVAGYQDSIEIKEHTLSVTIASLRQTADRWKIPRRARKAFRAVAFEVLFFIGEYGLVTRGADALYDLSPLVFHGLFAPLLAALGDADMMEAWLARTQVLAEVDLRRSSRSEDPLRPPRLPRGRPLEYLSNKRPISVAIGASVSGSKRNINR